MPTTTSANIIPAPKRSHGTDLLTRKDLLDIIVAILDALPNAAITTSTHSSCLTTQLVTNPLSQPITSKEEWQHQEKGEQCY